MNQAGIKEAPESCLSFSIMEVVASNDHIETFKHVSSTYLHRIRNALNILKMSLYFLKRSTDEASAARWLGYEHHCSSLETLLDRLRLIYKTPRMQVIRCPLECFIQDRGPTWRRWVEQGRCTLELEDPDESWEVDFDPSMLSIGLDAFVSWRAETMKPGTHVRFGFQVKGDEVQANWREIASSWLRSNLKLALGDGRRSSARSQLDSLALPLLGRSIVMHGGCLEFSDDSGIELELRWPRFRADERTPAVGSASS